MATELHFEKELASGSFTEAGPFKRKTKFILMDSMDTIFFRIGEPGCREEELLNIAISAEDAKALIGGLRNAINNIGEE